MIGVDASDVGASFVRNRRFAGIGRVTMRELMEEASETINIGVEDNGELIFISQSRATAPYGSAAISAAIRGGYTVSRSEYTLGVMSIAVPVFDRGDRMRMVLQCPGLEADLETREWQVAEAMRRAAGFLRAVI